MDLSDDRNNNVVIFCEITGCDVEKATTMLESVNWNIESAVSLYYEEEQINNESQIVNELIANSFLENNIEQHQNSSLTTGETANQRLNTGGESQSNSQEDIRKTVNNFNKFMTIFITICGTGLAAFLGFFKTMFCFPGDNNEQDDNTVNQRIRFSNSTRPPLARDNTEQIERDRKIREEQDIEYLRSLNLDSMKQERINKRRKLKELLRERRIKHNDEIKSEGNSEICKELCSRVCVKNLAGKKFQRNFSKNDKACKIYKWIDSLGLDENNLISDKFSLRLPHHKSIEIDESYLEKNVTIEELGLFPSALLLINNIDEDVDE